MWNIIFGRHWVYLDYKEERFQTPHFTVASVVYLWWYTRYLFSVYPVKYIKIYKVTGNIVELKTYSKSAMGE